MAACPNGHESATQDYCDVCGAPIGGSPSAPVTPPAAPDPTPAPAAPPTPCPNCGTENIADALFCENCGYDFTTGQTPVPDVPLSLAGPAPAVDTGWAIEISADASWYALKATGDTEPFPTDQRPRTLSLRGHVAMIGRESASRGIHPDIDAGDDAAVSRRHAQLVHSGDQWQVVDLGSTNGTSVARAGREPDPDPLPTGQPRALGDGDSVMVGAWTRLTLRRVGTESASARAVPEQAGAAAESGSDPAASGEHDPGAASANGEDPPLS